MELIYQSGVKVDLNLAEIEEILMFLFEEFRFDKYDASLKVAKIIDRFLKLSKDRFGEIFVYLSDNFLKVLIARGEIKERFIFRHSRKVTKFLVLYLKDAIKLKKRFTLLVDTLTSLPNRRYFFRELERVVEEAKREKKEFAILFIDIKGFKFINDFYGHDAGDVVLQEVANRLKMSISGFLARIGADEFVVILKDLKKEDIEKFVNILIKNVEKPVKVDGNLIDFSLLVGVAVFPDDGKNKDEILQAADLALDSLKHNEENQRIAFFETKLKRKFIQARKFERDLKRALQKNEFFLVYQPKIDANSFEIVGVEALIRWLHPVYGIVPNGKWIEILEDSKYLKDVSEWVLKRALLDINNLNFILNKKLKLSINVDIRDLIREDFIQKVSLLPESSREILTFELLERKLVKYWDELVRVVRILHSLKIDFSFDDFGTGNTTLKYLTKLFPDEIKIDRSFVSNIHTSKTYIITKAMIAMAKSLNIKIVAEGVEKKEELEVLKTLGCDIIQGFYFAKPMKVEELKEFIKNWDNGRKNKA
jgi:diguanylate cyclase (GGDEF)-like protein